MNKLQINIDIQLNIEDETDKKYVLFLLYCILYFIRTYRSLENEYNLI